MTASLYVVRRVFEQSNDNTYVVSLIQQNHRIQRYVPGTAASYCSLRICRIRIMNLPLPSYIPVSVPTPIQAGRELILTVLSFITARSTPFAAMRIRCWPVKRTWNLSISSAICTKSFLLLIRKVLTQPCWTMPWNFWS